MADEERSLERMGVGSGTPALGSIVTTPAFGLAGPNFIVREANGYRSREEIMLKQAANGLYPEGLVLQLEVLGGDGGLGDMYVPFTGGEAAGILYQTRDVSAGNTSAVAVVRDCEVQRAMLVFAGTPGDAIKEAAYASLAAAHVVMR